MAQPLAPSHTGPFRALSMLQRGAGGSEGREGGDTCVEEAEQARNFTNAPCNLCSLLLQWADVLLLMGMTNQQIRSAPQSSFTKVTAA